jgi:hypothetical protein
MLRVDNWGVQVYRTERYMDLVAKVRRLQSKIKDEDSTRKPGEKVCGVTYESKRIPALVIIRSKASSFWR